MLEIKGLQLSYGQKKIFDKFDLSVKDETVLCILGVSGCGKTSLLNAIAGLIPCGGKIQADGDISYLFQEDRLIPSLTVLQNVLFATEHFYQDRLAARNMALKVLSDIGLEGLENRYPHTLSGGQKARVALARAFCCPSHILLMDEPFQGLDIVTRHNLTVYFLRMLQNYPRTAIVVSHSVEEAVAVADRIIVLGNSPCTVIKDIVCDVPKEQREKEENAQKIAAIVRDIRSAFPFV